MGDMSDLAQMTLYVTIGGIAVTAVVTVWHAEIRAKATVWGAKVSFLFLGRRKRILISMVFSGVAIGAFGLWLGLLIRGADHEVALAAAPSKSTARRHVGSFRTVRGVEFAVIPAGSNGLGCCVHDSDCTPEEPALTQVTIPKPYWMAVTEVTGQDYQLCVRSGSCQEAADGATVQYQTAKLPVTWIDSVQASEFCKWLGGDLPTEVEWEYAARGGRRNAKYPWGDVVTKTNARFLTRDPEGAAIVASFPPNGYGLYDMAGNVAEWCIAAGEDGAAPSVVVRGGSFKTAPDRLRVSARVKSGPDYISEAIGFRCVIR